jgi:hypothetical protein
MTNYRSVRTKAIGITAVTAGLAGVLGCGDELSAIDGEEVATTSQALVSTPVYTELTLQNGWVNAPAETRNAGVALVQGLVQFKGTIASGINGAPFNLPAAFRPSNDVYVSVNLSSGTMGRLRFQPGGAVTIEGSLASAQGLTSLEGVSFAPSSSGFTTLTLQNSWTTYPGSAAAAARIVGGVVHLRGAIRNGTTSTLFTLPAGFQPTVEQHVPINLCGNTPGRLHVFPSGVVSVEGGLSSAQCFTSLDGAKFVQSSSGFTTLTLQNGWIPYGSGTGTPGAKVIDGVVHLKGAISSGANNVVFTLPASMRPASTVHVLVDMCGATKGRLAIPSHGQVSLSTANFLNAQCFTSLDGVSFTRSDYAPIVLAPGWTNNALSTSSAAVALINGVAQFKGGIGTMGTNNLVFNVPAEVRPSADVYLPVVLCDANKGRLQITPAGDVFVSASNWSAAKCLTSLEGASYAVSTSGFTPLTLMNNWAQYNARPVAAKNINGTIRLSGAVANGTSGTIFDLPTAMSPPSDLFLPVDLCGGAKGRLYITPGGLATVVASNFSDAQCFTSLEGVQFALNTGGASAPTLQNGWVNAPYATRNVRHSRALGTVRFQGAVGSGIDAPIFTLPDDLRPTNDIHLEIDLCGGAQGRLRIQPSGAVTVRALGSFGDASCFTSLEGASYSPGAF